MSLSVPVRTPFFDGGGTSGGQALVKSLGNFSREWTLFFGSDTNWVSDGTHIQRTVATVAGYVGAAGVPEGALFVETDRNAIYQARQIATTPGNYIQSWVLILGSMTGLLANRPTDLGANDAGFLYNATDALSYSWNGSAWQTSSTSVSGTSLADANRLTKVGAAVGTLAESSITDDGTKVSLTEHANIDTGAVPADSQLKLAANLLGALQLLCINADQLHVLFDQDWTASGYIARNASIASIQKHLAQLIIRGATGQTVGSATVDAAYVTIDLATGDVGFGGNVAPAYAVDATGDVNASGVFRKAGTPGISVTIATSKINQLTGAPGSMTFIGGILTAQVQAT